MRTPINIWNVRFLINFGSISILIIFFLLPLSSSSLANELQRGSISSKSPQQGSLKAKQNLRSAVSKGKRLQLEQADSLLRTKTQKLSPAARRDQRREQEQRERIKKSMQKQKVDSKKAQQEALASQLKAEQEAQNESLSGALLQPQIRKGVKVRPQPIQKSKQGVRREKK